MSDTPEPGTVAAGELVDRLCDEFEQGWLGGGPVPLANTLQAAPAVLWPELFRELLAVETEYRGRDGRPMTVAEARAVYGPLGPWAEAAIQDVLGTTKHWESGPEAMPAGPLSAALDPRPADLPETVGGYRVVRRLGQGGMGVVYLVDDPLGNRQVAIKMMHARHAADAGARARFLREARSAMAVENDHVVAVYQVGVDRDTPFLVMPLLRGESLEDRLVREPLPPLALVLKVGREVALGLASAHDRGLVHRDVKPANTWLEGDPGADNPAARVRRVKVLDFGLARSVDGTDGLSMSGAVVGTPAYMAPEQAGGRPVDPRADLFSLGAVLYRMATGQPAFAGPSMTAILTAIATFNPPPPAQVNPAVPAAL
jgi:serine/threonine protein kinase